jgi:AraC-like DNA-binding protein
VPAGLFQAACQAEDLPAAFDLLDRLLDQIWAGPVTDRAGAIARLEDTLAEAARALCPDRAGRLRYFAVEQRAQRSTPPNRFQVQTGLETMAIVVCDGIQRLRPQRQRDLKDLLNAIEKRPVKAFSLGEAAAFLSLTPSHLSKKFKATTGRGFVAYVTARRLRRAGLLLAQTDLSVHQIAAALDFSQANYFARVFKAEWGVSPSQFRQRVRAGTPPAGTEPRSSPTSRSGGATTNSARRDGTQAAPGGP